MGNKCASGQPRLDPRSRAQRQSSRQPVRDMRLRGPGYAVTVPQHATRQDLMAQLRRGGRSVRGLTFSGYQIPSGARLRRDVGMQDDAQFEVDDACDHAGLAVGNRTRDGFFYECRDCGARGGVRFANGWAEPTPEARDLLDAWHQAGAPPWPECQHPEYESQMTRNRARHRDVRWTATCTKCHRNADQARARVGRFKEEALATDG
jgi:hypothetical protein